jgi:pyruvate,water dikinase
MSPILAFNEPGADRLDLVGGKGANLGRLSKAGFPVPPGCTITTECYRAFIAANDLQGLIGGHLDRIDYGNAGSIEAAATAIRQALTKGTMSEALEAAVTNAYQALGEQTFVAVRSSGTAEDLEAASFAGQHDTYLDVRGTSAVVDAVKRCWASLWTARAVAYRREKGFGHSDVGIAVVLQTMVESEISGVMFTANPMTTAVDEYVVNASYGLGEAIVSGIVTPDLFVLNREDLTVRRSTLGSKTVKIVRDPAKTHGTIERHVATEDQQRACLTPQQLAELGALGARVARYYEGYPQDIEWGLAGGKFYLLQSRDITGVEFSWDEDLDAFQNVPKDDNQIWTRSWSDSTWTGRITPLFYSARAENAQFIRQSIADLWGLEGYGQKRIFKFHKGFVYYGSETDYVALSKILHPSFRADELLENLPPALRDKIRREPFSWFDVARMLARIQLLQKEHLPWNTYTHVYRKFVEGVEDANGLPPAQIGHLSDEALKKYCDARNKNERDWVRSFWTTFYFSAPMIMGIFTHMVENWLGEKDPSVRATLLTGSPLPTVTEEANNALVAMAMDINAAPILAKLFESNPGAAFFEAVRKHPGGAAFASKYDAFLEKYGHRGQADRDISFDRRWDNPGLDYTALASLRTADHESAERKVKAVVERRKELTAQFIAKLKLLPFGDLRAQAFVWVQDWLLAFWRFRDDQRAHVDRATFSQKRAYAELGRRLSERSVFAGQDDYYMFSMRELFAILDRGTLTRLDRAKLKARKRNYDRFRVEFNPPKYMLGDQYADLEAPATGGDANQLRGVGMSRGIITGTARVISSLTDIGRVQKGDILVTFATDPGWTPVFVALSGLVLETGGMLAHGACISREYGIPAVQVAGAMTRIPDGATISVNGDMGTVTLVHSGAEPAAVSESAAA